MTQNTDILISGAGLAGLIAGCAFGNAGFKVICVDPSPPVTDQTDAKADMRSTAFLQPARDTLAQTGIWDQLAPFATPLQIMRLIDAGGETPDARHTADFNAAEISDEPFAWNLPNWLLKRELLAKVKTLPNVTLLTDTATQTITLRTVHAKVMLTSGTSITTKLLIAADGRNSTIREQAGIGVQTWRYGQKALAFTVSHPLPHHNASTEVHRTGGPFTLVPLPDKDGMPQSSVVWMDTADTIDHLMRLDTDSFNAEMTTRSTSTLGPLTLTSHRSPWPIISQLADRLTAPRTALIAEAAHVVPPIGAQGLNMSLGDIQSLLDLALANPDNIGSTSMLTAYEAGRYSHLKTKVYGIDALNRASLASHPTLRDLRLAGLKALHSFKPIRTKLMKAGLG